MNYTTDRDPGDESTARQLYQGEQPTCRQCGEPIDVMLRPGAKPGDVYDVLCPHCGGVAARLEQISRDIAVEVRDE